MNKSQIAKKYSRAIISSADMSHVPVIIGELKTFSGLLEENRKLKLLFAGQIFNDDEKDRALKALFPLMKPSGYTEKFLRQLVLQGHLFAITEIIRASTDLYNERQKKATAEVTSAVALDEEEKSRLKVALKELTSREVDIESKVDSSLLGGFIVKVGSTIYDSSLLGQLRLLKTELTR